MPGPPENRLNLYIDKPLKQRLYAAAKAEDVSMASYIKTALVEKLGRRESIPRSNPYVR